MATFHQISIDITQKFLQTVVVVDDGAEYSPSLLPNEPLAEPGIGDALSSAEDISNASPQVDIRHRLDAKVISDAFAEEGLVCSILRPEVNEIRDARDAVLKRTARAAHRADLLILDWQITGDQGNIAKNVILQTLEKDHERIRLIAIYTGENELDQIVESVESFLKESGFDGKVMRDDTTRYALRIGPAKIEIFSKGAVAVGQEDRHVAISDLPKRLIESFSLMTEGIVSNMAISAISAIRENTHRVLSRLHKDLSGPYLVQRALAQPEDAFDFLVNLIGSEIQSLISEYISEDDYIQLIDKWFDQPKYSQNGIEYEIITPKTSIPYRDVKAALDAHEKENRGKRPIIFLHHNQINDKIVIPPNKIREWIVKGKIPETNGFSREKLYKKVVAYFCEKDATTHNAELALLSTLRMQYGKKRAPMLSLGTLLKRIGAEGKIEFLLCIQPPCDSVRLDGPTLFPFLSLVSVKSNERFHLVVPGIKYMRVENNASSCEMIRFPPNDDSIKCVRAVHRDEDDVFLAADGTEYHWIADLKETYAQRIINQFAYEISRVGVNELEWLRLSAKK